MPFVDDKQFVHLFVLMTIYQRARTTNSTVVSGLINVFRSTGSVQLAPALA